MDSEELNSKRTDVESAHDKLVSTDPVNQQEKALDNLQEDIIRNDTIPETSKDTPGSNGAFPVGAFDTSKE